MRVLIVEDESILALDLEILVVEQDYYVCDTATHADEAVFKAALYRPDVVLMDIRLADGGNGIEAARQIRDKLQIPCIFVSGNLDRTVMEAIRALHPAGLVPKPVRAGILSSALKQIGQHFHDGITGGAYGDQRPHGSQYH